MVINPGNKNGMIVCCKIERNGEESSDWIKSHFPRWQLYPNVPFALKLIWFSF